MDNIIKTSSQEEFTKTICEIIKEQAHKKIEKKGSFTFVLSGGRTPKYIFDKLASSYMYSIDWDKVHFFWLDERCVEPDHVDSNYKLAYDNLISKLNNVGSVHRIEGELEPNQAAKEYKKEVSNFFSIDQIRFDFVLLGMGEDGHVASLFPNSAEVNKVDDLVLATDKDYNGYRRITFGLNLINTITYKLLLIKGDDKLKLLEGLENKLPINKIDISKIVYYKNKDNNE